MQLICAYVFAYAKSWFSHDAAHIVKTVAYSFNVYWSDISRLIKYPLQLVCISIFSPERGDGDFPSRNVFFLKAGVQFLTSKTFVSQFPWMGHQDCDIRFLELPAKVSYFPPLCLSALSNSQGEGSFFFQIPDQRTNGPVNAHLISKRIISTKPGYK